MFECLCLSVCVCLWKQSRDRDDDDDDDDDVVVKKMIMIRSIDRSISQSTKTAARRKKYCGRDEKRKRWRLRRKTRRRFTRTRAKAVLLQFPTDVKCQRQRIAARACVRSEFNVILSLFSFQQQHVKRNLEFQIIHTIRKRKIRRDHQVTTTPFVEYCQCNFQSPTKLCFDLA